ncbi:MAG: hypothetical protein QGM50_03585 [Anaerolineae bacterium]|nr:hypothetical protein [Anaerolineae bacterium]
MAWKLILIIYGLFGLLACTPVSTTQSVPELAASSPTIASVPISAPIVNSANILNLHMFNERDGWGISENSILRTIDGGVTWYNVSPQGLTTFGYGVPNAFLNASQAWVIVVEAGDPYGSGTLYRTNDGGQSWTVFPVPFGGGNLSFTDDMNGWMMENLGGGAGSMAISIYRSENGGATWSQSFTNDPSLENTTDSLPLHGIKYNLTPLNSQTAWVGGVVYAPDTLYLYKTSDAGRTWALQSLPTAPGMQNTEISIDSGPIFSSQSDGILPVRYFGETFRTGFFSTHDGGGSWEFITAMPGTGAVDFVSLSAGFFWTGEQFFSTSDGGHSWTNINSDVLFGESFVGMDFVSTHTGWVWTYDPTGQYGLYQTTDGGKTWIPLIN